MYVHKSLRTNCATCAESPGSKLPATPAPRAPKTPLRKRPDGEQMTARCKGLRQTVSEFPRATTQAK